MPYGCPLRRVESPNSLLNARAAGRKASGRGAQHEVLEPRASYFIKGRRVNRLRKIDMAHFRAEGGRQLIDLTPVSLLEYKWLVIRGAVVRVDDRAQARHEVGGPKIVAAIRRPASSRLCSLNVGGCAHRVQRLPCIDEADVDNRRCSGSPGRRLKSPQTMVLAGLGCERNGPFSSKCLRSASHSRRSCAMRVTRAALLGNVVPDACTPLAVGRKAPPRSLRPQRAACSDPSAKRARAGNAAVRGRAASATGSCCRSAACARRRQRRRPSPPRSRNPAAGCRAPRAVLAAAWAGRRTPRRSPAGRRRRGRCGEGRPRYARDRPRRRGRGTTAHSS